jgi:hypothetical protein
MDIKFGDGARLPGMDRGFSIDGKNFQKESLKYMELRQVQEGGVNQGDGVSQEYMKVKDEMENFLEKGMGVNHIKLCFLGRNNRDNCVFKLCFYRSSVLGVNHINRRKNRKEKKRGRLF